MHKNSLGCKEQLTIDAVIIKQAEKKRRNLSMAYVDYRKAFDSIPHDWLIKSLQMYKIHPNIISALSSIMTCWETQIHMDKVPIKIKIKKGIYQGDSLSPLLFCLALNPLSYLLNQTNKGYKLNPKQKESRINHLLFMDDLKLYDEDQRELKHLLNVVKTFSSDIKMVFGNDKCAEIHIQNGKLHQLPQEQCEFQQITENTVYEYLGIQQNRRIDHTALKAEIRNIYKKRLTKLLNTKLNSRNLITAVNTYAVPVLIYSFGVLKYSDTDLHALDRLTRTLLTKFRMHHPKSAVERTYLPRKEGGRGLINIFSLLSKKCEIIFNNLPTLSYKT